MSEYVERFTRQDLDAGLGRSRIVGVFGPRQAGKTTLIKQYVDERTHYIDLDDDLVREGVDADFHEITLGHDRVIIDEVHRLPELFYFLKASVDKDQRPGRFIISSSLHSKYLGLISDSLAGRISTISIKPLSYAEITSTKSTFTEILESGKVPKPGSTKIATGTLIDWLARGGYPRPALGGSPSEATAWLGEYVEQMARRDILELSNIHNHGNIIKVLHGISSSTGSLLNSYRLHQSTKIARPTIEKIIDALVEVGIIYFLRPHHDTLGDRMRRRSKVAFIDTGILSWLLKFDPSSMRSRGKNLGVLVKNFVFSELIKQRSQEQLSLRHRGIEFFRDNSGKGIDFIVPLNDDQCVAFDVKASRSIKPEDLASLRKFAKIKGDGLKLGFLLYIGHSRICLDKLVPEARKGTMWALPVSSLAQGTASASQA